MPYTRNDVAKLVDHILLRSEAAYSQVYEFVEEANGFGVCSVCVSPSLLPPPFNLGDVRLMAVCGLSSGAYHSDVKAAEMARTVTQSADEVDTIIDLARVVGNESEKVEADIYAVREVISQAVLKVIIGSATLGGEQIIAVRGAIKTTGAGFAKTLTGFHPSEGASIHAVILMKATVGETIQIKVSDGIRDGKFATELLDAGTTRPGLSAGAKVLNTF